MCLLGCNFTEHFESNFEKAIKAHCALNRANTVCTMNGPSQKINIDTVKIETPNMIAVITLKLNQRSPLRKHTHVIYFDISQL